MRLTVVLHESAVLGAGVAIARVLPALRRLGWQPSVVFPEDGPLVAMFSDVDIAISSPERPIGVSIKGWRRPPGVRRRLYQSRQYFVGLRTTLREQRPDVVHVNSLHALPEGATARSLNFPTVLHAHEIPAPGTKRSLAIRGASALTDIIVPVSETVRQLYAPSVSSTRLMTVHNGVSLVPPATIQDNLVVGTVGSICERKGTDVFIEASRIVKRIRGDVSFEHIGPSITSNSWQFDKKLAELTAQSDSPLFLGAQDVAPALPRWGIFVLPSRQEAFPLATLEAMATGIPVIASNVGGLSEQIIDGETGILVPAADPTALARAIVDMIDNPTRRQRLGEAARNRVAEQFTYEHQALGLDQAYRAALSRRSHKSSIVDSISEANPKTLH